MSHRLYWTYQEIADEFDVTVQTVRNWKNKGQFEIIGYRHLGKWLKEAVVETEEVKKLMYKKFSPKK